MPALPEPLRLELERAISEARLGRSIRAVHSMSGGCVNRGARIETDAGAVCFLKWNPDADPDLFAAEADGLGALARAGSVRVPGVVTLGGGGRVPAWLLLEYLPAEPATRRCERRLGHGLAAIHAHGESERFGWHRDNWIGSLTQDNTGDESWGVFWRERRIAPQLRRARERGWFTDDALDRVVETIEDALEDVVTPQLLHGDLWSGNAYATADERPVLIDPAVYFGDGEVDLAMSELFGGFGPDFYDAYREVRGISDAYTSHRRELYQLYYLLVHVNLFGGSYVASTRRAADRVLTAWR